MLTGLGRWLRAAGYDTAIAASGASDDDLLAQAHAEGRVLLTCDRRLAAQCAPGAAVLLRREGLDHAAAELRERLHIDWLRAPFSRCLRDNAPLMPANEETIAELPATAHQGDGPVMRCPQCNRVYWPGSHVRRMLTKLTRAQA